MIAAALTEHVCLSTLLETDPGLTQGDEEATCRLYEEILAAAGSVAGTAELAGMMAEDLAQDLMVMILEAESRRPGRLDPEEFDGILSPADPATGSD